MPRLLLFIFGCLIFTSLPPHAEEHAAAIGYIHGFDDIKGARLTYRPLTTELHTSWFGTLNLYWETSLNFWEYGNENKHSTNIALAISPVFIKQIGSYDSRYPLYVEAGIGASLVNNRHFAGKDIGTHYQFEDRLGLVISINEAETSQIAIRYMHYSNGGLNEDNPGLNFLNISYISYF